MYPKCLKSNWNAVFKIGYTAEINDCTISFSKWQKLTAITIDEAISISWRFSGDFEFIVFNVSARPQAVARCFVPSQTIKDDLAIERNFQRPLLQLLRPHYE